MVSQGMDLREAGTVAAAMLVNPTRPTYLALQVALAHHDHVLRSLSQLLRTAAQLPPRHAVPASSAAGGVGPIPALLHGLEPDDAFGPSLATPPSDRLRIGADSIGGWLALDRSLLIAAHAWSRPPAVPEAVRHGLIADVAAIAAGVAVLQVDLADRIDEWDWHGIDSPDSRGLRQTAAQIAGPADAVLDAALARPVQHGWTPIPAAPTQLRVITTSDDVRFATTTLARILSDPGVALPASDATVIMAGLAMTSTKMASYLNPRGDWAAVARALQQHGQHLLRAGASVHDRLWSSPVAADHRAARQASEIYRGSVHLEQTAPAQMPAVARQYARTLPAITAALSEKTVTALGRGAWHLLEVDSPQDTLSWRRSYGSDAPALRDALRDAGLAVKDLGPATMWPDTTVRDDPGAAHRVVTVARLHMIRNSGTSGPGVARAHRPPPPVPAPPRPARPV